MYIFGTHGPCWLAWSEGWWPVLGARWPPGHWPPGTQSASEMYSSLKGHSQVSSQVIMRKPQVQCSQVSSSQVGNPLR